MPESTEYNAEVERIRGVQRESRQKFLDSEATRVPSIQADGGKYEGTNKVGTAGVDKFVQLRQHIATVRPHVAGGNTAATTRLNNGDYYLDAAAAETNAAQKEAYYQQAVNGVLGQ